MRIFSSVLLLGTMALCYAMGHIYYTLLLIGFAFKCHFEIMDINRNRELEAKNPMSKVFEWFVPVLFCFYLAPKTFIRRILIDNDSMIDFKKETPFLYNIFFVRHTFICSLLLIFCIVIFTLTLKKGSYKY